jgi:hypothetical protein
VETIKRDTSKTLSRKYNLLKTAYWDNKGIWVKGYFVSTLYCRFGRKEHIRIHKMTRDSGLRSSKACIVLKGAIGTLAGIYYK